MQTAGWKLEDRQRLVRSHHFFRRGASSGLFFCTTVRAVDIATGAEQWSGQEPCDCASAQIFTNGVATYGRGEYAIAQEVWRPLTHSGNPATQRILAHLFRMGLGVAQKFIEGGRLVLPSSEGQS